MTRTVTGPITLPDGSAVRSGKLRFTATRNNSSADGDVPKGVSQSFFTTTLGGLRVDIDSGQYRVDLQMPNTDTWITLGNALVEAGGAIPLGELIELTDTNLASTYPDIATRTWVEASYSAGTPSSIDVTDLGIGRANAGDMLRVGPEGIIITGHRRLTLHYFLGQSAPHLQQRQLGP